MRNQTTRIPLFIAVIVLAGAPAQAALTIYTNRDAWNAAHGGTVITDDFGANAITAVPTSSIALVTSGITVDVTGGTSTDLGALSIIAGPGSVQADDGSGQVPGSGHDLKLRVDPDDLLDDPSEFTFTFFSPVNAFAFDYGAVNIGTALTQAHLLVDGQSFSLFDEGGNGTGSGSGFIGVVSDTPLASFILDNGPNQSGQDDFRLTRIEVLSVTVPEPTSASLVLVSLGFLIRRRRSA